MKQRATGPSALGFSQPFPVDSEEFSFQRMTVPVTPWLNRKAGVGTAPPNLYSGIHVPLLGSGATREPLGDPRSRLGGKQVIL